MNPNEKAIARVKFRLLVLEADGQAFQDLFWKVIQKSDPQIDAVKPQGNRGDRKNDGFNQKIGKFFQVYAPEDSTKNEALGVKKVKEDFAGLKKYWHKNFPIKQFYFVLNDKFNGAYPDIYTALAEIKKDHGLQDAGIFLAKDLEDALFSLKDDEILSIINGIPDPEKIQQVDFSVLKDVVDHICKNKKQLTAASVLSAPDFGEKIKFNCLGETVASMLNTAGLHVGVVDEYFSLNSTFARQELRDSLNEMYTEAKKGRYGNHAGLTKGDLVFFEVLKRATPNDAESAQTAALIIMAYFFEHCDIFEDPNPTKKKKI